MKKYGKMIGFILIVLGIFLSTYNYFLEKRNKAIENMNMLLLENLENVVKTTDESVEENIENNETIEEPQIIVEDETNYIPPTYYYIGRIEIPKINLNKGFLSINDKDNNINKNIMVHELSDYPDITNATVGQQRRFGFLANKIRLCEYIDVGDNIAYLFAFQYETNRKNVLKGNVHALRL